MELGALIVIIAIIGYNVIDNRKEELQEEIKNLSKKIDELKKVLEEMH